MEEKNKSRTITLGMVFGFLGFLFIIFLSFLIYLRFSSISPLADFYHKNPFASAKNIDISVSDQINQMKAKKVEIKLTEAELGKALLADETFPLKDPSLKITADGIIINGKTKTILFPVNIEILIGGEVQNGKIQFKIQSVKAGGVTAPEKISTSINNYLNKKLLLLLPVERDITFTDINFFIGFLMIEGERK
jgi:uncharacterized protein YpmS